VTSSPEPCGLQSNPVRCMRKSGCKCADTYGERRPLDTCVVPVERLLGCWNGYTQEKRLRECTCAACKCQRARQAVEDAYNALQRGEIFTALLILGHGRSPS
jgi:hypothetical protein